MSTDPLSDALVLLARGHRLYGDPVEAAEPAVPAATAPPPAAGETPRQRRLAALGAQSHAADRRLRTLLRRAHTEQRGGYRQSRAMLDEARGDAMPAVDTPLGRREALRRMAARLHAQHRRIAASRRRARRLARHLRRLRYPGRPRRRTAARRLPTSAVDYTRRSRPGRLDHHIAAALDRLGIVDPAARRRWTRGYRTLIARESSGRATAVADAPAAAAGPLQADGYRLGYARGLTQTLPATFAHYHQPGTSASIYDPVANICASMNYVMARYGVHPDAADLAALVQQADPSRPPKGY